MAYEDHEKAIAELFAPDRTTTSPNEQRVKTIMARVNAATGTTDVVMFIFIRMWLTVLEFGAQMYAGHVANRPHMVRHS